MQESEKVTTLTGTGYVVIDDDDKPVGKIHTSLDKAIAERDASAGVEVNHRIAEVGLVVQATESKPKVADDPLAEEGRMLALDGKYPTRGVSRRFLEGYLRLCQSEIDDHLHLFTVGLTELAESGCPHARHDVREWLADLLREVDETRAKVTEDTGVDVDYVIVVDDEDEDVVSDLFSCYSAAAKALETAPEWAEGHKVMAIRYDEHNAGCYEDVSM